MMARPTSREDQSCNPRDTTVRLYALLFHPRGSGQIMAEQKIPTNFNALYSRPARAARGVMAPAAPAERPAVARLTNAVPDVAVEYDDATQNPVRVSSRGAATRL